MSFHGLPCWYELSASDTKAPQGFYSRVLGWTWADSGMPGMSYQIASTAHGMVAGMMTAEPGMPVAWSIYIAVTNCDETAALAASLGAKIIVPPTDIPNTGRFAVMIDPQGAAFSVLQPLPGGTGGAFDQQKSGHGNWLEVVTANPKAALEFYGKLFGWTVAMEMPMGPDMSYHIIACNGQQIGGTFAPNPPAPAYWKPYFGAPSIKASVAAVTAAGGKVRSGPDEVPGGAFTLQIEDAQGVRLALVGPM